MTPWAHAYFFPPRRQRRFTWTQSVYFWPCNVRKTLLHVNNLRKIKYSWQKSDVCFYAIRYSDTANVYDWTKVQFTFLLPHFNTGFFFFFIYIQPHCLTQHKSHTLPPTKHSYHNAKQLGCVGWGVCYIAILFWGHFLPYLLVRLLLLLLTFL